MEAISSFNYAEAALWCYLGILAILSLLILGKIFGMLYKLFLSAIDYIFEVEHNKDWMCYSLSETLTFMAAGGLAGLCCALIGIGEAAWIAHGGGGTLITVSFCVAMVIALFFLYKEVYIPKGWPRF